MKSIASWPLSPRLWSTRFLSAIEQSGNRCSNVDEEKAKSHTLDSLQVATSAATNSIHSEPNRALSLRTRSSDNSTPVYFLKGSLLSRMVFNKRPYPGPISQI